MKFNGKITKNFLIVLDKSGTFLTAVRLFNKENGKTSSNLKLYVNSNENNIKNIYFFDTLLASPDLKGSYITLLGEDGNTRKVYTSKTSFSTNISVDKTITNVNSGRFFDLIKDSSNDSKYMRKVEDSNGNTLFLLPSGIRRSKFISNNDKTTELYAVDLEDDQGNVLFNVPINAKTFSEIRAINSSKAIESDSENKPKNCLSVSCPDDMISKQPGNITVLYGNTEIATVTITSMDFNTKLEDQENNIKEQQKILDNSSPITIQNKSNLKFKAAWKEASNMTGLIKKEPFEDFLEDYIDFTGNNKTKVALESFNFLTEAEGRELIKVKNPTLYTSMKYKDSEFNIAESGIKIGVGTNSLTMTKDGVEMSSLRVKDGKNQLTTGPVPIPTVANDANDLKPDGSAFLATARRYPIMNEIVTTLKVITYLSNVALKSVDMIMDMNDLKNKFVEYRKQGK